jgi:sec-independent protein translocase protein TatA
MRLGPLEIGLILVIILIVFGVGKLPQVGTGLGKAIKNFKDAQAGIDEETSKTLESTTTKTEVKPEEAKKA